MVMLKFVTTWKMRKRASRPQWRGETRDTVGATGLYIKDVLGGLSNIVNRGLQASCVVIHPHRKKVIQSKYYVPE